MTDQTLKDIDLAFKALEERNELLDKIRSEINGLIKYYPYPIVSPYQTNIYAMLMKDEVLQIIDKYRNGKNK